MSHPPLPVLLVGAAGAFGRRLAEGLADEPGVRLILAGRRRAPLDALRRDVGRGPHVRVLDRARTTPEDLTALGAAIVIDAAGPFQDSRTALIEAAIDAGCHYIDLADGRDFVANVHRYGAAAQRARVAVLSGASSTPALSHAVLDEMTAGWRRIDTLRVAIGPGSRAPRGLSVVRACLSWAGRPVRVFRDGAWTTVPGWGAGRRVDFPGLGARRAALAETPDLDLLVSRYRPRVAAEFLAGLEPALLQYGVELLSLPVRRGWLRSLSPLARPLRALAALTVPFGRDCGGMVVEAAGRDGGDRPVLARWSLCAGPGKGPYVPTLAALALVRRIRDGRLAFRGAGPCTGILTPDDFAEDFARLGIATGTEIHPLGASLFERALGGRFDALPPATKAIHRPDPVLLLDGIADMDGAESRAGRLIARLMGFPGPARDAKLRVVIEANRDGGENWARVYPDRVMRSVMAAPDAERGTVEERFGSLRVRLRLDADKTGLALTPVAATWRTIPLPLWLLPRIAASERAAGDRHLFDVSVSRPLLGRLVHYRGSLTTAGTAPQYPSSSSGKALSTCGSATGAAGCR